MSTFKQVAARLRVLANDLPANANVVVRKTALAIDQALVFATPVDTGRARSNWQVTINSPAEGEVTNYPKSKDAASAAFASGSFAVQAAIKATQNFAGGSIFITNNLPYITPLNEGHSQQAPEGFVQQAVLAGIAAVQNAKLLEKPQGYGVEENGE
jgi:hypothetical protein